MKKTYHWITSLILLFLLASCSIKPQSKEENCKLPRFMVAIPKFVPNDSPDRAKDITHPAGNWELVGKVPDDYRMLGGFAEFSYVNRRLWFRAIKNIEQMENINNDYILSYDTQSSTWRKYATGSTGSDNYFSELFVSRNGTIYFMSFVKGKVLQILVYENDQDRFVQIFPVENSYPTERLSHFDSSPVEDSSGNIWLNLVTFSGEIGLYRFEPIENRLVYAQPSDLGTVRSMVLGPDNHIWMIAQGIADSYYSVFRLDPISGKAEKQGLSVDGVDFLYFDRHSNLWVSDKYWVEVTTEGETISKYEIIRSPLFITENGALEDRYGWQRPSQMYQSSDDIYWFTAPSIGTVKLDVDSSLWCLFTSGASKVVEDDDGNIWIIVDELVYKRKLN